MDHFGVSMPQASIDISIYIEQAPNNLKYDSSSRSYHSTIQFKPLFAQSAATRYLAELLASQTGLLESRGSFIGAGVEIDFAPTPSRAIDDETVALIVRAIKGKRSIFVKYQSMTSSDTERQLSPLALGHDGFRWHVRAFCHLRNRFSDFVLTRLSNIREHEFSSISLEEDLEWNTVVSLVIIPHPDLPSEKRAAIAYDYGMIGGETVLPCRQALLFYTLKHLGFANQGEGTSKHIYLKNQEEVQLYLDALRKGSKSIHAEIH